MVDKSNGNSTIDLLINENNSLRNAVYDKYNGTITDEQLQRWVDYDTLELRPPVRNVWWFNRKHHRHTKKQAIECPIDHLIGSITIDKVKKVYKRHEYRFDNKRTDFALNLLAVRTDVAENVFTDVFVVIYWYRGKQVLRTFDMTTNVHNDAMGAVACGQYVDKFELRNYKGRYEGLCQKWGETIKVSTSELGVVRDHTYDIDNPQSCNIVVADKFDKIYRIEPHSGYNQIIRDGDDFADIMSLCSKHRGYYGNNFTYTIVSAADF